MVYRYTNTVWREINEFMGYIPQQPKDRKENRNKEKKLKRIRSRKKTAVIELAEAAGVNETAVRNYEIGYRQASRR